MGLLLLFSILLIGEQTNFNDIFKLQEKIVLKPGALAVGGVGEGRYKVDSNGNIWMIDFAGHCLLKFSTDGVLLKKIDHKKFKSPIQICIDKNDNVYVADPKRNRISIFNNAGKLLKSFPAYYCFGVKVDDKGNIYVKSPNVFKPSSHETIWGYYIHKFNRNCMYKKSFYIPDINLIRKLAMADPVLMDIGKSGNTEYIYAMDVTTAYISILTLNGKEKATFAHFPPSYKAPTPPKKILFGLRKKKKFWNSLEAEWTRPINLIVANGYLFVVFWFPQSKMYTIDIYDTEGKFITSVETEHCLLCADKSGYLHFGLGGLTIGKYSLNLEIHN